MLHSFLKAGLSHCILLFLCPLKTCSLFIYFLRQVPVNVAFSSFVRSYPYGMSCILSHGTRGVPQSLQEGAEVVT